jgi:hypothetical protein
MNKFIVVAALFLLLFVEMGAALWYVGNTCSECTTCTGWDAINPVCQAGYAACQGGFSACTAFTDLLRLTIVGANVLIMLVIVVMAAVRR